MDTFANAVAYMREHPGTTLIVPKGEYILTGELARDTQKKVMEGFYGEDLERSIFNPQFKYDKGIDLGGLRDCRIEAYGASFMVDGFMEPVSVTNCENVEICGFSIDHMRKPYSRGVVTHETTDEEGIRTFTITLDDACPIHKDVPPLDLRCHLYQPETGETYWDPDCERLERIDEHHIELAIDDGRFGVGTQFYAIHTYHSRPAILIEYSKNIRITDVTIHSQPGMGIVGNRSEDIFIKRLSVVPSNGHHMSTNTDATHFTSIKGKLVIEDSRFIAQGDDLTNVHAYFHQIIKRDAPDVCYLQEKTPDGTHAQTLDYPDVGDTLELTSLDTLQTVDKFTVLDVVPMHEEWMCKVTLDHPLPQNTHRLVMADVTRLPEVTVRGCTSKEHYARGVLIKCRKALIENNQFHNVEGSAIAVAAEAGWHEGVCPANVTIRNNIISENRSVEKFAGIYVRSDCNDPTGQTIRNIVIENNVINAPRCPYAIQLRNIDGVTVRNNVMTSQEQNVVITDCTNIYTE